VYEWRETGNAVGNILGVSKHPQRLGLVGLLSCTRPIPKTIGLIVTIDAGNNRINSYKQTFIPNEITAL
jgi:hypothetical protein